jgi:hypothetical protein
VSAPTNLSDNNPNIDAALKQIRGVIFIKELEVKLITEEQQQNR